jgi:Uncharacterized protein conserved in bacteria
VSVATIKQAILEQGGWLRLFEAVAPELQHAVTAHRRRVSAHVSCPVHGSRRGERGDGFRLFADADRTGGGVCNSCGQKSDGIGLLSWVWGVSTTDVLRRLGQVLDGASPPRRSASLPRPVIAEPAAPDPAQEARAWRALHGLFAAALPLSHADAGLARCYLQGRGLRPRPLLAEPDLRFHPFLYATDEDGNSLGRHPGLLAAFRAPDGRLLTLQRTFLLPDGRRNRDLPKLTLRLPPGVSMAGGAIRLGRPHCGRLGIAEGWETAGAARQLSGIACWATTGWALLEAWEPPADVIHVDIWADNDTNHRGQRSADALADRLIATGRHVTVHLPAKAGHDWCDVALAGQEAGQPWRLPGGDSVSVPLALDLIETETRRTETTGRRRDNEEFA